MAAALHVVLQVARLGAGRRQVVSVSEITGMEGDVVITQDLFRLAQTGGVDRLEATGITPTFAERFARAGYDLDWGLPAAGNWSA